MSRPLIVIADREEEYVLVLEKRIISEINKEMDLEIITDPEYCMSFFSLPKTAEIVLISEELYDEAELRKHNISHLFVLTENPGDLDIQGAETVNRYASDLEIFNQIVRQSRDILFETSGGEKETRVISFFAAGGGTGKTSLSLGLAKALSDRYHRVLYINAESIQSFGYYMANSEDYFPEEGYRVLRDNSGGLYAGIKAYLRSNGFSYLPPMMSSLDSRNLSSDVFVDIINQAKATNEYDYIIVDVESGYSEERLRLLEISTNTVLVVNPDEMSATKMLFLENNASIVDRDRYICVCNRCKKDEADADLKLRSMNTVIQSMVFEAEEPLRTLDDLAKHSGMEILAQVFVNK